MHPYRQVALVPTPTVPPLKRPLGGLLVAGITAAATAVSVAAGGPLALVLLMTLSYGFAVQSVIEGRQRRRAFAIIRGLPFPVRDVDPDGAVRPIRSLRFALEDGGDVVIDDWTWGGLDVVLLAHTLSTLGVELHTTRGVISADVIWGPGGPVPSI